MELRKI